MRCGGEQATGRRRKRQAAARHAQRRSGAARCMRVSSPPTVFLLLSSLQPLLLHSRLCQEGRRLLLLLLRLLLLWLRARHGCEARALRTARAVNPRRGWGALIRLSAASRGARICDNRMFCMIESCGGPVPERCGLKHLARRHRCSSTADTRRRQRRAVWLLLTALLPSNPPSRNFGVSYTVHTCTTTAASSASSHRRRECTRACAPRSARHSTPTIEAERTTLLATSTPHSFTPPSCSAEARRRGPPAAPPAAPRAPPAPPRRPPPPRRARSSAGAQSARAAP